MRWKSLSARTVRAFATLAVVAATTAAGLATSVPPAQAATLCRIVLGEDGASWTIEASFDGIEPGWEEFPNVPASSFIRSTAGPCTFQIYNHSNFGAPQVTLGSGLNTRIRAGLDGVSRKDDGGGETWRVRSVFIVLRQPGVCALTLGHTNGVRMNYYGEGNSVPAMNRAYALSGCSSADLYANTLYRTPSFHTGRFSQPSGVSFGFSARSFHLNL